MGELHDNLFLLHTTSSCKSISEASSVLESVFQSFVNFVLDSMSTPNVTKPYLFHMRLGHAFDNKLHALHSYLPNVHTFHSNKNWVLCPIAKQKRLPFPSFNHVSDNAFDLINCDVWGPFARFTHDGFRYLLTIVDDATRSTWVYLMKSKYDTKPLLISFYNMINT